MLTTPVWFVKSWKVTKFSDAGALSCVVVAELGLPDAEPVVPAGGCLVEAGFEFLFGSLLQPGTSERELPSRSAKRVRPALVLRT